MLGERRRTTMDPVLLGRVAMIWAVLCVLLLATNFAAIWERRFPDPDDTLRLIQVRDLLAGQGWFDLTQHRIAPPEGVAMHWSRLVDLPLAAMILALAPLLGSSGAEMVAMVAVPLLTLGCALLLIGRIAWQIFDEEVAGLACLTCATAVPVIQQLRPMRIDHHGWQIVALLVAANGLMARDPRRGGWTIGAALAVWLSISIEALPLAAAFVAVTAFKWLRNRCDRVWMVSTMQSLAVVSGALFLATRGLGDLAQQCDAISPVHLAVFAWGAVIATVNGALEPHPRGFTLVGMALMVAGALGIVWGIAPQCAASPFAGLDPVVRTFWYDGVAEGLPVWRQAPAAALQMLAPPLLGLIVTIKLYGRSRDWLRRWWGDYALLLAAATLVSLFVARAAAASCVLAAVPLGWQLRDWMRQARNLRRPSRRALALAGVVFALAPALPLYLFTAAAPAQAAPESGPTRVAECRIDEAARALNRLPASTILAPLDVGPGILEGTRHRVVATAHHRAAPAMREVIDAFRGTEATARRLVAKRGVAYVALCPTLSEPLLYAASAPDGFAAMLVEDRPPAWLKPVSLSADSGLRLYRVAGTNSIASPFMQ